MDRVRTIVFAVISGVIIFIFYHFNASYDETKIVVGSASFFTLTIASSIMLGIWLEDSLLKIIKMQTLDFENWVKKQMGNNILKDQTSMVEFLIEELDLSEKINNRTIYYINDHNNLKHILYSRKDVDSYYCGTKNELENTEINLSDLIESGESSKSIKFLSDRSRLINDTIAAIDARIGPTYKEEKVEIFKWLNVTRVLYTSLNEVNAPSLQIDDQYFWGLTSRTILHDKHLKKVFEKIKL